MPNIYTIPNISEGIDNAIVDTVQEVSIFTPMFLIFVWFTVFLGGYLSERRRTGGGNSAVWSTIASLSTLLITLPLTLTTGLIDLTTLVIVVVITIASGFWLFMDKSRGEI